MSKLNGIPDAMSDVLDLVRMRAEFVCAKEYSAPWSVVFTKSLAHFHIVEQGSAWLEIEGAEPTRIETGDLLILPLATPHVMFSAPGLKPVTVEESMERGGTREGVIYRIGGGGETTHVIQGHFTFDGVLATQLLKVLPPLIHLKAREGKPLEWLRITSHFLMQELRDPKPGSAIMISRLLDLVFVQAVRDWGVRASRELGWLGGLADPAVGRALAAIHDDPAIDWTVERLAKLAGLSRSAFAARFTQSVGQTPLKYVGAWRLDLAADHLRGGAMPIGRIARSVGYGSEPAFTRAFKSRFGATPALYRRAQGKGKDALP